MNQQDTDFPALDPAEFPLSGLRLIEASAGTGKTFAIANLVVRLVVETGLGVERILVVTFTRAATEELRGRVRERIRDALQAFEQVDMDADDAFLQTLKQRCPDGALRLKLALESMDESAIFTIHGFCQRVLSDNAFESGSGFEMEFVNDDQEYRLQAIRDFWRRNCYGLPTEAALWLLKKWPGPEALLSDVANLLIHPRLDVLPQVDVDFEGVRGQLKPLLQPLREQWPGVRDEVIELLVTYKGLGHGEKAYRKDKVAEAAEQLDLYLMQQQPGLQLPVGFKLFTSATIAELMTDSAKKKDVEPPSHDIFGICEKIWQLAEGIQKNFLIDLQTRATAFCRDELKTRKQAANVLSPDDLLTHTHAALHSATAELLAERIRTAYPVALIDEFQDTDPLQYEIFQRVYRGHTDNALIMIGDPKQAIYGFRGADIFTYLSAAEAASNEGEQYSLDTNWRSTEALVEAVNALFSQGQPFVLDDAIRYQAVGAAGRTDKEPLQIEDDSDAAMHFWLIDDGGKKNGLAATVYRPLIAQGFAAEIARLLTLGQAGQACIGEEALQAKDIAVLVRDRHEAAHIQQALRACGVGSAFISRDDVFDSDQAGPLLTLLEAVLGEGREDVLRPALGGPILGWDAQGLERISRDEQALESVQLRFREYARHWRRGGFMPMFSRLLHAEQAPARFLAQPEGERILTNLRHLGELLQAASGEVQGGPEGLLRWYRDELAGGSRESEDAQLRLESDENLVQVVTVHKSKGLQYPLVFLPYPWGCRPYTDKSERLLFHTEDSAALTMDLGSDDFDRHLPLAERERLAEDMRLLYVALTRAKYRIYTTWGHFNKAGDSAFALLMELQNPAALCEQHPESFALVELPKDADAHLSAKADALSENGLRRFEQSVRDDWRVTSYSALIATSDKARDDVPERPDFDALSETTQTDADVEAETEPQGVFAFPRGTRAGQCLHGILEEMDFQGENGPDFQALVERQLLRQGLDTKWRDLVVDWLWEVLETPLDTAGGLRLSQVDKQARIAEMGFYLPLQPLHAPELQRLLRDWRGEDGPRLDFAPVQGMLNGFIDLIIEHQGRYYVLDYKSNHLGNQHSDYGLEAMTQAVRSHQYDLQYLIYCVALHRYLSYRQADYDYERHFGGVYYLFLRGMRRGEGDKGVYHDRPSRGLIESLDALFGTQNKEAATC